MPKTSDAAPTRWLVYSPPLLLMVLLAFSWFLMRREADGGESLRQSNRVRLGIVRALSALQEAETGQRGYLLTGSNAYLEPYLSGRDSVMRHLQDVSDLTKDEEEQQRYLEKLIPIVTRRLARLDSTIRLRKSGVGLDSLLARPGGGSGKALMDSARLYVGRMWSVESRLLLRREVQAHADRRRLQYAIILGVIVSAMVSLFVSYKLSNDATRQWLMSAELRARIEMLRAQSARTSGETRRPDRNTPGQNPSV